VREEMTQGEGEGAATKRGERGGDRRP
jgi:hypothetical protein